MFRWTLAAFNRLPIPFLWVTQLSFLNALRILSYKIPCLILRVTLFPYSNDGATLTLSNSLLQIPLLPLECIQWMYLIRLAHRVHQRPALFLIFLVETSHTARCREWIVIFPFTPHKARPRAPAVLHPPFMACHLHIP